MLKPLRPSAQVVSSLPGYRCYCCNDTGLVIRQYAFLEGVIPSDVGLMCRRCNAAVERFGESTKYLDYRVTPEQCEALHRAIYEDWLATVRKEGEKLRSAAPGDELESELANEVAARVDAVVKALAEDKTLPKLPELNPQPERPITELDGYKLGDRVRITLKQFSSSERKEIIENGEATPGEVGQILRFEIDRLINLPVAIVQFENRIESLGPIWFEPVEEADDGEVEF